MKILIAVPQSRTIAPALESIERVDTSGHSARIVYLDRWDDPSLHRWQNVNNKYRTAREIMLAERYDALLCLEDDLLIPPDALHRLVAVNADIAYGLTVTRRPPHHWSADIISGPADSDYEPFDNRPEAMRAAWGRVVDVVGCGLFCTLIRRPVLERLDFVLRGTRAMDFYLAWDALQAGFSQKCDFGLICGHIMDDGAKPLRAVYPDVERRYRIQDVN